MGGAERSFLSDIGFWNRGITGQDDRQSGDEGGDGETGGFGSTGVSSGGNELHERRECGQGDPGIGELSEEDVSEGASDSGFCT